MLALSPLPPQTDGERAFFAELARWDTGASVRAAVVASLPLTDGPLNRRLSDAVLFVPEGVAVVRVVEVVRQSGVVTASPEGAWTIGPEGQPGEVLQLSGGGSTPLDGLMRAGMDVAMRLRQAGLEPGRIARLTVLVGEVSGLVPADGDLGEGDHVAVLDTRSLLLGIARASRYSGIDNPRLWTTADVRAGLEAIGLQGRGPSVQELNGEGFPYSPYVLRRPELMAPAAMAAMAAAGSAPETAPPPIAPAQVVPAPGSQPPDDPAGSPPPPATDPEATRVGEAGGQPQVAPMPPTPLPPAVALQPQPQPPAPTRDTVTIDPPPPARTRDTVNIDAPPAPAEDEGIGGLFAHGEQITGPTEPPRTSVFDQPPVQYAPPGGSGAPSWGRVTPVHDSVEQQAVAGNRSRRTLLIAAAVVAVLVIGLGVWLLTRGAADQNATGNTATSTAAAPVAGPKPGDVQTAGGVPFTVQAVQVDRSCAGHAYGQVGDYLQATDCIGLSRALYSAQLDKGPIVVSVIRVRMPDTATARELRALADRNGSGNVSNLLREGVRYSGSPAKLSNEEYASAVSGTSVTIVETSWVDPAASGSSAEIDAVATNGLALETPPFPRN